MKTFNYLLAVTAVTLLLAAATVLQAGPSPQYWNRPQYLTPVTKAAPAQLGSTAAMVCSACKTATLRDSKHVGPAGKGHEEWFVIGSRHECGHCGGTIAVVQGKTTDSMARTCSMCGKGATFHCATQVDPKKT